MGERLKKLMLLENVDIKVIQAIKSLNSALFVDETIFVSPSGDDSDGSSWDKAYNLITTAIEDADSDLNKRTMILLSTGRFDVDTVGIYTISKNVFILSASTWGTSIVNDNASATGIFRATQETILCNIIIECGTGMTGVQFDGIETGGSELNNVTFSGVSATTAHTCIHLINGARSIYSKNIRIIGTQAHTIGLHINSTGSIYTVWEDIDFLYCLIGFKVGSGNLIHYFDNMFLHMCTSGIEIDITASQIIIKRVALVNCTTEITDNGTGTSISRDLDIDSIAGIEGYTEVLYVSPNGDDSDGKTWSGAFNEITTALAAAGTSINDLTGILLSAGIHDINVTGNPTYSVNAIIKGQGRNITTIINNHASATSVINLSGKIRIEDLTIDCGTGNNGVKLTGDGSEIRNTYIEAEYATGALTGIELIGEYFILCDIFLHGVITDVKGILLSGVEHSVLERVHISECLIGIHFDAIDLDNHLIHSNIHGCATGLQIDVTAVDNKITHLHLSDNIVNIIDNSTTTDWDAESITQDIEVIEMYPIGSASGIQVQGAAAEVYGGYVTIAATNTITQPFKIVGIGLANSSDINAQYFIDIAFGATDIVIATISVNGASKAVVPPPFKSGMIPANSQVRSRCQTSNGGNDTINVWIQIIKY